MSNVTRLPDSMVRQWRAYGQAIDEFLAATGCSADEIEHVRTTLKPIYLTYAKPKSFELPTGDPDAVVQALSDWVQSQVNGLLVEVMKREVALYRLRGPAS